MEKLIEINSLINSFVWGPVMLALLVGTGIFLTFAIGFPQVRKFGYVMKNTLGKIFSREKASEGEVTPF